MGQLTTFFAMGGYAPFVWPAFGVVTLGMGALVAQSLIARRRARAEVARLEDAHRHDKEAA